MAIHRHKNQVHLDRFGNYDADGDPSALPAFEFMGEGETVDTRTWSAYDGVLDGLGLPVDVGETLGIQFEVFTRTSDEGRVFARTLTLDPSGGIVKISREKEVSRIGSSLFAPTSTGITPKGTAKVGVTDAFFTRQPGGVETRLDFTAESESLYMHTPDGEQIQLKGKEPEDPENPIETPDWSNVRVATVVAFDGLIHATGTPPATTITGKPEQQEPLRIDGVAVAVGDRVLIQHFPDERYNGIYEVRTAGDIGISFVLRRASDAMFSADFEIDRGVTVEEGAANAGLRFAVQFTEPFIMDETIIRFVEKAKEPETP